MVSGITDVYNPGIDMRGPLPPNSIVEGSRRQEGVSKHDLEEGEKISRESWDWKKHPG